MVQQLKASRSGTKGHMTRSIGLINGYANKVMNQQEANSLEVLEGKLKGLYETYVIASRDILEKLRASKATQEELDEEQTITLQTQDEILGARAIIKQKKQEWLDDERDRRLLTLFQATNQASNLAANQATKLREDLAEDVEVGNPEPIQEPEEDPNPTTPEQKIDLAVVDATPATEETDDVVEDVEPDATGSVNGPTRRTSLYIFYTAPYTVLRKEKEYEERLYPAQKWVKTQTESISKDSASSAMFWKLFNYISGQNDKKTKVPMTAPVSVFIEPGSGPNCESTFTMAFNVPAAFQDDTPQPTESDVTIEERPEFKVLARTYGGFSNDRVTQQERQNLFDSLAEEDKQLVNQTGPYYYAGYDPPFKLFYRRNEVWMIPQSELNLPLDAESQQHTTVAKPISSCDEKNESDN
ncbi:hypothetical protein DAPPUDRAFT_334226 [Daphnia pulex]|uniref:Heme-binding protein 1 n=1 Tax=Daphnia pulex TaxID=6669 RepID=E9HV20_DAPPU|nr:hypothetical protein DAPPUDRAFT_334226 [Daphnia pulex]|eukprot:EFX64407.1 hypothetical protein DAPPUDRAFT_334226 [Daphnia pulex]